jgi:hypothetical protein
MRYLVGGGGALAGPASVRPREPEAVTPYSGYPFRDHFGPLDNGRPFLFVAGTATPLGNGRPPCFSGGWLAPYPAALAGVLPASSKGRLMRCTVEGSGR